MMSSSFGPKFLRCRPRALRHLRPSPRRRFTARSSLRKAERKDVEEEEEQRQVMPLEGYYKLLLDTPFTPANAPPPSIRLAASSPPPNLNPRPSSSTPASQPYSPNFPSTESERSLREARARVVFGSRLAGPIERAEDEQRKREQGKWVHGVFVPPKPVEPDNCCMSGCVNCVLTRFVDELDEWKTAKTEARRRTEEVEGKEGERRQGEKKRKDRVQEMAAGMDDDGGGRGGLWEGFEDIPIGLRVFMETEKKLKARKGGEVPA